MLARQMGALHTIMPDLANLLRAPANLAAYYAGVVWADWTHLAANLTEKEEAIAGGLQRAGLLDAIPQINQALGGMDQALASVEAQGTGREYEHFFPGLRRHRAYLRGYSAGPGFTDSRRMAFHLGLVSHMYQDIVFHNDGLAAESEFNFIYTFGRAAAWSDNQHEKTEYVVDLYDWTNSSFNDEVRMRESFPIDSLYHDFHAVYRLLGATLPEDIWTKVAYAVEIVQWQFPRMLGSAAKSFGLMDPVYQNETLQNSYYRGGLLNGAAATQVGVMRWFAQAKGWYWYQNEIRSELHEAMVPDEKRATMVGGRWEHNYLPYVGASDATIDAVNPTNNAGGEPLLSVSADGKRTLIRFEMNRIKRTDKRTVDVDGIERSIPHTVTVDEARLWLCFAGRKSAQADDRTLQVYKVNRAWAEGIGRTNKITGDTGVQARAGEVCFASPEYGQRSWAQAGCDGALDDRDELPFARVTIPSYMPVGGWFSLEVTSVVQQWIDDPAKNFGLLLTLEGKDGDSHPETVLQFYSSEANQSGDPARPTEPGFGDRVAYHPILVVKPRARWTRVPGNHPDLSDTGDWHKPQYYSTIQTQVATHDGEERLYLLARGTDGIMTWRFDFDRQAWEGAATDVLPLTDTQGWGNHQYYSTIQTQALTRNGEGMFFLVARGADGIMTWRYDFHAETWVGGARGVLPLSDGHGWDKPQYYSTIQTQVVRRDGNDELFLLARGSAGLDTWRFDFDRETWVSGARNVLPFPDAQGWDKPQYYSTIQTQVTHPTGDDELFLLARGSAGVDTWRLNFDTMVWNGFAGNDPPLTDTEGWDLAPYYATIHTRTVHRADAGQDVLHLFARSADGVQLYTMKDKGWTHVNGSLALSDFCDWQSERYYTTIRTLAAGDPRGNQRLFLFARKSVGVDTYCYDPTLNVWRQLISANPPWGDGNGWNVPERYRTIQVASVNVRGEYRVVLIGRGTAGMETYLLDIGPSGRWLK
ncbi:DNRLRE domain-containing protein [Nonomuraea jabiensis]|uniref:DNRLRE domain-containing protein n=1 Tax=Nonomuraea jabiensis TaxID=882448 RepID=UPI003D70945C